MKTRKIVCAVYPDAKCLPSQGSSFFKSKIRYAIFRVRDGVPISNEWHGTRREAWKDAADDINERMLRKLEL